MSYDYILVRYGEIALKGKNRAFFEERLAQNIRNVLKDYPNIKVRRTFGRIYIELNDFPYEPITESLKNVFGLVSFSPVKRVNPVLEEIKREALAQAKAQGEQNLSFKIESKRPDKNFPITSPELAQTLGAHLLTNRSNLRVDLHDPQFKIYVEVRIEGVFIYSKIIKGIGGLPGGASGKAVALLSGGIDSPVACWMAMRRGVELEALHFHSYPVTSLESIEKVVDIAKKLAKYTGSFRLYLIPFLELQAEIRRFVPENYNITIMRRIFMRLAEKMANRKKAYALVTGESLGQVASQTLYSLHTINEVTKLPILRPLIAMDKQEIIAIARTINTYKIAIRPYEDCCTIFIPRNPATKPMIHLAERYERLMAIEDLIDDAITNAIVLNVSAESEIDLAALLQ